MLPTAFGQCFIPPNRREMTRDSKTRKVPGADLAASYFIVLCRATGGSIRKNKEMPRGVAVRFLPFV
jgi:hypothetical protein